MTIFQTSGFFISSIFVLYSMLWGDTFKERLYLNFFNNNFALRYLLISIAFALFGLSINYSVQSAGYLTPLIFIIVTRLLDLFSLKLKGRHFYSIYKFDNFHADTTILDIVLTYLILFLSFVLPIGLLNFLINGRMFD
jgi:hypothetical protein